ncbi:MAG: hypothetical protein H0W84_15055 [Bacteroidetes bacterium]|nr:hypothetical protein [Bacteroidota bacterium]
MKAVELRIQEAQEKADEWIVFLATYSDARLDRRIDTIRKQQVIAEQNKDEKGFDLLLLWEHITICARMYKEEHNVPDSVDEMAEEAKLVETVIILAEKRQEIYEESSQLKTSKPKIIEEDKDQTSLF